MYRLSTESQVYLTSESRNVYLQSHDRRATEYQLYPKQSRLRAVQSTAPEPIKVVSDKPIPWTQQFRPFLGPLCRLLDVPSDTYMQGNHLASHDTLQAYPHSAPSYPRTHPKHIWDNPARSKHRVQVHEEDEGESPQRADMASHAVLGAEVGLPSLYRERGSAQPRTSAA